MQTQVAIARRSHTLAAHGIDRLADRLAQFGILSIADEVEIGDIVSANWTEQDDRRVVTELRAIAETHRRQARGCREDVEGTGVKS
jgi:hypothetical protein